MHVNILLSLNVSNIMHYLCDKFLNNYPGYLLKNASTSKLRYKFLNGHAPKYLNEFLCSYISARSLQSSNQNLLISSKISSVTFEGRGFTHFVLCIWNKLNN